ncbi:hypothetical protein D3M76_00265, partial [Rodentibacter pneumotropicus]
MTKIIILGKPGKTKPQEIGKKGRQARMFEKSRKMTALWEKVVVKPSAVDSAINLAVRDKKLIDIANYNCVKGKIKSGKAKDNERQQKGQPGL